MAEPVDKTTAMTAKTEVFYSNELRQLVLGQEIRQDICGGRHETLIEAIACSDHLLATVQKMQKITGPAVKMYMVINKITIEPMEEQEVK